jgi:hypothetical protein
MTSDDVLNRIHIVVYCNSKCSDLWIISSQTMPVGQKCHVISHHISLIPSTLSAHTPYCITGVSRRLADSYTGNQDITANA